MIIIIIIMIMIIIASNIIMPFSFSMAFIELKKKVNWKGFSKNSISFIDIHRQIKKTNTHNEYTPHGNATEIIFRFVVEGSFYQFHIFFFVFFVVFFHPLSKWLIIWSYSLLFNHKIVNLKRNFVFCYIERIWWRFSIDYK